MSCFSVIRKRYTPQAVGCLVLALVGTVAMAQTGDTGAITGVVTDAAGGVVPMATVKATSQATGESRTAVSGQNGSYSIPLVPPGIYNVEFSKTGFKGESFPRVSVIVTETQTLNAKLEVGAVTEHVTVSSDAEQLQTASSALGHVTNQEMVANLPLVTRNYTQIIGLNAGVSTEVTDARQLGRGEGGERSFSSGGGTVASNNYQMDGVAIDDLQNSGDFSGGVAIPNPDTIQEFKVQTGQYDATYGRNSGANVNVITKGGTNQYHGTLFEYFRNEDLNANDFFFNRAGLPSSPWRNPVFLRGSSETNAGRGGSAEGPSGVQ